jgi:hypothetical protein
MNSLDQTALCDFLQDRCLTRHSATVQVEAARLLGCNVRHLQDVFGEAAQHNGHLGSSSDSRWPGIFWSVDDEDALVADSNIAGRIGPLARRRKAIHSVFPGIGQLGMGF